MPKEHFKEYVPSEYFLKNTVPWGIEQKNKITKMK